MVLILVGSPSWQECTPCTPGTYSDAISQTVRQLELNKRPRQLEAYRVAALAQLLPDPRPDPRPDRHLDPRPDPRLVESVTAVHGLATLSLHLSHAGLFPCAMAAHTCAMAAHTWQ